MLAATSTEQPLYHRANNHTFAFAEDCRAAFKPESKPEILTKVNDDGSTSNYFDKRKLKIAPRSTLQFKVGPPFHLINNFGTVIDLHSGRQVLFQIHPRIDRGFDSIEDEWVGYKRNYFTLVSSFEAQGYSLDDFLNSSFQLSASQLFCGQTVPIKYFAMIIRAKTDDSEMARIKLVQHTAKRDKGPQFEPQVCPLIPSQLPRHQVIREASNVRNENKMKKYESTFFFYKSGADRYYSEDAIIQTYPTDCIQKVARYERVQFAASISTKKPGQAAKYFKLHVVLGAVVDPRDLGDVNEGVVHGLPNEKFTLPNGETGVFFDIQEMETSPLVIRGRSPSNYTGLQHYSYSTTSTTTSSTVIENVDTALVAISSNLYTNEKVGTEGKVSQGRTKNGRPAKRTAKVVRVGGRQRQSKAGKENVSEVAGKDGEQGAKNKIKKKSKNKNKKKEQEKQQQETEYEGEVQTLEQIQHIILTQLPLYSEQLGQQALEQTDSPAIPGDFGPVEPTTVKTTSIGLKDIELRPSLRRFLRQSDGCTLDTLSLSLKSMNSNCPASVDVASAVAIDYGKYYRPRSSSYDISNSSFCENLPPLTKTALNECGGDVREEEMVEEDDYDINNNININMNNNDNNNDNDNGNASDLCDIIEEKEGEREDDDDGAEYMSIENISFTFYNHTRHINTGASEEDFNTSLTTRRELSIEQFSQLAYGPIGEQMDYHATRYMLTTSGSNWESTEEVIRGELISTGKFV